MICSSISSTIEDASIMQLPLHLPGRTYCFTSVSTVLVQINEELMFLSRASSNVSCNVMCLSVGLSVCRRVFLSGCAVVLF